MLTNIYDIGADQPRYWLIFSNDRVVAHPQQPHLIKASWDDLNFLQAYSDQLICVGQHQGLDCYAVDVGNEQLELDGFDTLSLRALFLANEESLFFLAARAWQYVLFRRTHRYCGKCGFAMEQVSWEMAVKCSRCDHRCYPRVSPCVIVAIRKDDKILLAQGPNQKSRKMHSVLAGFVESGESLEQAVHREVFEEVKIRIKNLRYFGSQPWPFPHSLMMGFLADYESGHIQVDGKEILEADWYAADNLPFVPPNLSIAGQLIEHMLGEIQSTQSGE